jgi:hypothetical protein
MCCETLPSGVTDLDSCVTSRSEPANSNGIDYRDMVSHFTFTRRARSAVLLGIGTATICSVAACSTSTPAAPTVSSPAPSVQASAAPSATTPGAAPPGAGRAHVVGLVTSVSGSTIAVAAKNGSTTVALTPSTQVFQISPAQLTDIGTGSCVAVRQARNGTGSTPAPARSITVSAAAGGQCPQSDRGRGVRGAVASVNGQTLSVADSAATPATVQVDNSTRYFARATVNAQAVTQGVCLMATGSTDTSGVLQAAMATVRPAVNGSCGGVRR